MKTAIIWLVSIAALVMLGVLIHAGTPPSPRWTARVPPLECTGPEGADRFAVGRRLLAVASSGDEDSEGSVALFDLESGQRAGSFCASVRRIDRVRFSPTGRWVVAVAESAGRFELHWLDLDGGEERVVPFPEKPDDISLRFSPHDAFLTFTWVSAEEQLRLMLLDPVTGDRTTLTMKNPTELFDGFFDSGKALICAVSERDRSPAIWRKGHGGINAELPRHESIHTALLAPRFALVRSAPNRITVHDLDDPDREVVIPVLSPHEVKLSPDGSRVAYLENATTPLVIADADSGRELGRVALPAGIDYRLTFAPDSRHLLVDCHERGARGGR